MPDFNIASVVFHEKLQFLFRPARYKVAYGGRMGLKCLGKGTKVLMYSGELAPVENIVVGDLLMGPDSTPRKVLSTTRGIDDLYRIKQSCGISYVVNSEHILALKKVHAVYYRPERNKIVTRYPSESNFVNVSVKDYLKKSPKWKAHFAGYKAACIEFEQERWVLPVHPYFLGLWLGDGTTRELRLTAHVEDIETIKWCEEYVHSNFGLQIALCSKAGVRAYDIGFAGGTSRKNVLWQEFISLGVAKDKHIPFSYQIASEYERLELLAGLIDSDGSKSKNGYNFVNTNKELVLGFKRLADFLGFRTTFRSHQPKMQNAKLAYTVHIAGETWRIPCKLPRKQFKQGDFTLHDDFLANGLSVESIGQGEFYGFSLDGDHLFMLADGTVTHNSWGFARALLIDGLNGSERILCAREFQASIADSVHKLLADQISLMGMNYLYEVQNTAIIGRGQAEGTSFAFEGIKKNITKIKSYEGITKAWVEEAAKMTKDSFNILGPTIFRNPNAEMWLSLNPELDDDFIYQHFIVHEPPPDSVVVKTTYKDNNWLDPKVLAEIEHMRLTDPDEYLHVYEGHTKQILEGAIFADELRVVATENRVRHVPYDRSMPVHVAFDLGRNDFTSMWFFQRIGFEYRLIDFYQNRLKHIDHYLKVMQERGYVYGIIWLPHDAKAKTLGTRMSIEEQVAQAGYQKRIVPKLSIIDRINAGRTVFPTCYFDEAKCAEGIKGLRAYHYEVKDGKFSQTPDHDGSDCADAFTYFAVASGQRISQIECKLERPKSMTLKIAGGLGNILSGAGLGASSESGGQSKHGWLSR